MPNPPKIAPERGYMPGTYLPGQSIAAQADAWTRGLTQTIQQLPPGQQHLAVNPANPGIGAGNAANPANAANPGAGANNPGNAPG